MVQRLLVIEAHCPPRHCGEVTMALHPDVTFWPVTGTATEADAIATELRAAANAVRTHNANVTRPRWP